MAFAITLFLVFCVLPVVYMFAVSLTEGTTGSFTLSNYRQLLTETRQRGLLLTSILLGGGVAIFATILGAPLGLLLARSDLAAKRLLRIALVVPLVVPPYVMALAWVLLTGPVGLFARMAGRDLLSDWTYSLTGTIAVLGLTFYPLSMLATEAAARRVESRLEEAAMLVTRRRDVLWHITLPLIGPSVVAAGLIIFVLAISDFGVPALLHIRVFTTEVFTAFGAFYDFGAGVALCAPLLALALIVSLAIKFIIGERLLVTTRSVRLGLPLTFGRPLRTAIVICIAAVIVASTLLPLAALLFETRGVTRIASAASTSGDAIVNSLWLAFSGATFIVALAVVLGYGRARARSRVRTFLDPGFILLFAVPSTVVGVGIIGLWNRHGAMGQIYSSQWIIVIAYIARFVPVAVLMLAASVRQISTSSEEAAELAGASWTGTFGGIVLPQLRSGLAATWVVSFIFCFGELGATILVTPPGESTLPVRVYTLIANTPSSEMASLALLQVGITLIPLALLSVFLRKKGARKLA
ncbi:MAG: iron ABC transporter permease [Acidobacteria bacterium]|nr:iron ABC transporter permease [Acidobacteriota bacterium]